MNALLLVVAGFAAGLSGSIAGLASLFSYPALLAVGLPPTAANVTNTMALSFSTVGQAAGSRPELSGQAPTLLRLLPVAALGGATGAGLLLVTPPGAFERIVPFLVGGAALVLLVQPRIRAAADRRGPRRAGAGVVGGMFAVAVYGGYFGAAAGVLMLALVLVGLPVSLPRGNAFKAVLLGVANAVAAVGFAVLGPVQWWAVLPLALGLLVGGWCGPAVVRRLPAGPLRVGIALAGLALAVGLAVQAY
ncbi:sulfite exporter TauE/SafE family protein [Pseudonocardia sp.]|uniref:sulfite exporter TauE/SafE family protein n=1 Tax=Pseudonocardia sp. TaxID=60912 RepID=UPI002637D9B2|nr:sulfite exporter TauE/SafE family protein [Pseudonocardia sp.]